MKITLRNTYIEGNEKEGRGFAAAGSTRFSFSYAPGETRWEATPDSPPIKQYAKVKAISVALESFIHGYKDIIATCPL